MKTKCCEYALIRERHLQELRLKAHQEACKYNNANCNEYIFRTRMRDIERNFKATHIHCGGDCERECRYEKRRCV